MTIDLRILGYAGPVNPITDLRVAVPPSVTNNTYAITDSALCCYPVIGHVFAGINPPTPVTNTTFTTGFELVHFDWQNVTIQPGQTVTFMTFALQRDIADMQGATAQAEALVNLTDPNAVTGITAAEKAQIVNFRIP